VDLRRSSLSGCFRLPTGCFDQLTFLDIRDNCNVSTVHLTNLPSLQVLHCERLQLTSLHLNGQSLTHLHAHHNMLDCLIVMPVPLHLVYIDVSYNNFDVLPDWIGDLPQIDCLRVNNNRLTSLPERLFNVQSMRYLYCKNNRIKALPSLADNSSLITCVLYSNLLEELPSNFLRKCNRLRHLNVSFNRLTTLPAVNLHSDRNRINTLRLNNNRLDESIVPILIKMKKLKVLDLSHNRLRYFDDSALGSLTLLEELNLSSNELTALSSAIFELPALQVLKAHSNRIRTIPDLSASSTLQLVLDVWMRSLGRTHKKQVALFDIGTQPQDRVQVGFSETSGNRNKLCIRRVQCGDIFGMVDGSSNYELPKTIQTLFKRILLNTYFAANGTQRFTLISGCLLLHLGSTHLKISYVGNITAAVMSSGHLERITESGELDEDEYERIRSAGGIVDECNIINGVTPNCRQLGFYSLHPVITPQPINKSISITRDMDYIIIASCALWQYLSAGQIASILAGSINPQVAAKTLQDSLQACEYNGNSCIVVIRLLKPELAFRSAPPPAVVYSPMVIPPMRVEKTKDSETTLQKIEQRLEKISEVIAKMEDDTTIGTQEPVHSPGRKLYERIAAEEKVSSWMLSPTSTLAPPPPDPASSKQTQLLDELRSKVSIVDEFTSRSPFLTSTKIETVAMASEERCGSRYYGLPRVKALVYPDGKILPVKNSSSSTRTGNSHSSTSSEGVNHRSVSPVTEPPSEDSTKASVPADSSTSGPSSSRVSEIAYGNAADKFHLPYPSEKPEKSQKDPKGFPETTEKKRCAANLSLSEAISCNALRTSPMGSSHEEPEYDRSLRSVPYEDHRMPSPEPNEIWADVREGDSQMDHLEPHFGAAPQLHSSIPKATTNSGVYSIKQATRERHVEPHYRSFDYYSLTKVRPHDDAEVTSLLDFIAPSRTTTPFLEYASPHRRKMSVIDEGPEALHRSSSEERPPSTGPPPLPHTEAPLNTPSMTMHRRTISCSQSELKLGDEKFLGRS
ncbi:hypothetical protein GCK32_002440, partial [Trichostrongylus colubriformis]